MRRTNWKGLLIEAWAFVAVAAIAFAAGLLIGDLGASPKTETVIVAASSNEGEEADASETAGAATNAEEENESGAEPGAQVFISSGCGTCHALAAAGSTGETGPNLNDFLAPDDTAEAVEEMIVDPNSEIAEGYSANVMPMSYGQTLSKAEIHQLTEYLVATTPAKPSPESAKGGPR